ncbi:hypothetical protein ACL6C3_03435 [Capilliphycus salinus ALCB114379]|uniref:hypothetical protein n=1 Tax=Capilliphycus salinus TaxID=2768948 RepID=UPI0039A667AF
MGGGIYLIQDDDQLVEMMEQAYDSEDQLQELLETYPNLLAGDEIDRATPRRWLLISREVAIPGEEEPSGRWSLDHLFLDQDAIPTLVEIKRSHNADTRQKILGQMLDYAANVGIYWPLESTIAQFESNCREQGRDPEQVFEDFLGSDSDEERFWQKVKTNIQAGKIRLIFVADEIPAPLRRIVEFLNEQTDPVEVWALEIKQYVSQDGLKTLVPRVIGQTAEAQQKKSSATGERRHWDENSFFEELKVRRGVDEAEMAGKIHAWTRKQSETDVQWGTGDIYGGFAAIVHQKGRKPHKLFSVDISGRLEISSIKYGSQPPFDREDKWVELRGKFSSIGLSLPVDQTEFRSPAIRLSTVQDEAELKKVLETFDWVVTEIKNS